MVKLVLLLVIGFAGVCLAQNDGRYRPNPFRRLPVATVQTSAAGGGSDGRYRPINDGRYYSDNSGAYNGNDGRYYHDDSGKYNPDGLGGYSGQNGVYNPDGTGGYTGQNDKYVQDKDQFVGGGQYTGNSGGFGSGTGSKPSGAGAKPAGFGTGPKPFGAGTKPAGSGVGPKPSTGAGFGAGFGVNPGAGSGFGSPVGTGVGAGFGSGAGSGAVTPRPRPNPNAIEHGLGAAAGFGTPVTITHGSAAGKYDNRNYAIIRQVGHVDEDGYHYLYETENGITGEEQGKIHNRGTDQEGMKANGFFTYTGPDSVVYTVTYTADENGFLPQADHLPTPPPIPEPILRALEYQRQQGTL